MGLEKQAIIALKEPLLIFHEKEELTIQK